MADPDRCGVCGLQVHVLGCGPGVCCAPSVPVNMDDLIESIAKEANEAAVLVLSNITLPVAGAMAGVALIRSKISTDGDDPRIWIDLIRNGPASDGGLRAMEAILGLVRRGD